MTRLLFLWEVEKQCNFALMAAGDLDQALAAGKKERTWYSIQGFLVAAANVSKLLWPPGKKLQGRGAELRELLAVDDDSPLELRTFRDHFEHFDERIEKWATSSKNHDLTDSTVGPEGFLAGLEAEDGLRNFDTTHYAVTFTGDSLQLQPIIEVIRDLHQKAKARAYETLPTR